ncbi:hypothetical protein B0T26DRAFT_779362 [Lasiosphaeria miniovina]|uniref:BZIP domain-containing protein n=1 Tax=Lasiosphaeria miniovina TaxID=1954250 RepID=A0AA40AB39_9PEZI|nr:uncharacterized protein B0T26DRAFT_779362 [Lasiosphaeria miniovina]KAK0712363.1 hypothetical protein B0T26DRAFT_779362 [Lasiosphaeria miniovina]
MEPDPGEPLWQYPATSPDDPASLPSASQPGSLPAAMWYYDIAAPQQPSAWSTYQAASNAMTYAPFDGYTEPSSAQPVFQSSPAQSTIADPYSAWASSSAWPQANTADGIFSPAFAGYQDQRAAIGVNPQFIPSFAPVAGPSSYSSDSAIIPPDATSYLNAQATSPLDAASGWGDSGGGGSSSGSSSSSGNEQPGNEQPSAGNSSKGKGKQPVDARERNRLAASRQRQRDGVRESEIKRQAVAVTAEHERLRAEKARLVGVRHTLTCQLARHRPGDCNCELIHRYVAVKGLEDYEKKTPPPAE